MPQSPIFEQYKDKLPETRTYQPEDWEKKAARYIRTQFEACERFRRRMVREAWVAMAFVSGRQWVRASDTDDRLIDRAVEDWQVRLTNNYLRRPVSLQAAKATENLPGFVCLPASDDDTDKIDARACEKLIQFNWQNLKMQTKIYEFALLCFETGVSYFKVTWDPTIGELVEEPQKEETDILADYNLDPTAAEVEPPIATFQTKPSEYDMEPPVANPDEEPLQQMPLREGGVAVDVLSCFEVGVDPGAPSMDKARYAYHVCSLHIDEIFEKWPDKAVYVKPDHYLETEYLSAVQHRSAKNFTKAEEDELKDRARIVEYFEKPSPRYPRGFYAVIAGEVLLDFERELPHGELPFVAARHNIVPGRQWGDGTLKDLVQPQEEINARKSMDIQAANLMAAPKWLAAKGSVAKNAITSEPGEVVEYDPTMPAPRPIPPPPFSPVHKQIAEDQKNLIAEISGSANIVFNAGQIPSGLSGRAVAFFQDQVASELGPTVREIEAAITEVGRRILLYHRLYGRPVQTLRICGSNNGVEVVEFHKDQIRSTDVIVAHNSMLPRHLNYRREMVMTMFTSGVLGNAQDPHTLMVARKMLEFGELDSLYGDNTSDRKYAREEIYFLQEGQVLKPLGRHDHVAHIDEHLQFMNSSKFRHLDPQTQQVFEWHLACHYYLKAMADAGKAYWTLQIPDFPQMPPDPVLPPPPGQQPQQPQGQPYDAFGPDPALVAQNPQPQSGMDPSMLMAMMQQGSQPQTPPELQRAFPESTHGPGIGDMEQIQM